MDIHNREQGFETDSEEERELPIFLAESDLVEGFGQNMAPRQQQKISKKRVVCKSDDFGMLLDYLEDRSNFDKLFGSGRATKVGAKYMTKAAAWDIAAAELKALGFPETNGINLQKKWYRLFLKFKEAKGVSRQTGGGLTEDELEQGITLEDKLNGICEHFYKMDALFGSRANVEPPAQSGPMGFQHFDMMSIVPSSQTQLALPPPLSTLQPPPMGTSQTLFL